MQHTYPDASRAGVPGRDGWPHVHSILHVLASITALPLPNLWPELHTTFFFELQASYAQTMKYYMSSLYIDGCDMISSFRYRV